MSAARPTATRAGYTLLEIMIVVAIIGVLAAIAIPAFTGQMQRSRTNEAFSVIGEIREAQDSYYATFSRYCAPAGWNPLTFAAPGSPNSFDSTAPGWNQLGVDPEGQLRFRYRVFAGVPGDTSGLPAGITGIAGAEHWYVIQAQADLDGDSQTMVLEAYSAEPRIFPMRDFTGTYLDQGWE